MDTSAEAAEDKDDKQLDRAMARQQELLSRFNSLHKEAIAKSGPEPLSTPAIVVNRALMFGVPIATAALLFVYMSSWWWAIGGLFLSFIAVVGVLLVLLPDTTPRPGTEGFEAEQEVGLIRQFVTQLLSEPADTQDLASLEHTNRALEHYISELETRIPRLGSLEKGSNSISVQRHEDA
jgi:hypothetical protein